jgi:hypothetical protein
MGIYRIADAAKFSGISAARIRRWLRGYDYKARERKYHSGPVWVGQHSKVAGTTLVGFLDLNEIRFVNAFIRRGVSWKTMRAAHAQAASEMRTQHPFCTNKFVTDGRQILQRVAQEEHDEALVELTTKQGVFAAIIEPFLKDLEFADEDSLVRWWPLGRDRNVVLDPERNLGQPTAAPSGVPTNTLACSAKTNGISAVIHWFEVTDREVDDAIEFEKRHAA